MLNRENSIESLGSVLHGANGETTIRNRDDRVRTDQVREAKSLVFRDKIWSTDWRETLNRCGEQDQKKKKHNQKKDELKKEEKRFLKPKEHQQLIRSSGVN